MKSTGYRGNIYLIIACLALCFFLSGCSSQTILIAPTPPKKFERLGHASGKATGAIGVFLPAYYFIPMGLNSRIERAYADALRSVPGSTALINVTYEESWFWFVLGTSRTVTISGEAIRELPE